MYVDKCNQLFFFAVSIECLFFHIVLRIKPNEHQYKLQKNLIPDCEKTVCIQMSTGVE